MRYIKLCDKIVDWEWFTDGNMLKVWLYLLVKAQYADGKYRGVEVKRGELLTGRKLIASETRLSEQQVRTCINRLKSSGQITIESTNQYSLITIVKYDDYQGSDSYNIQQIIQPANLPITNGQPTDNQRITTYKKDKKEKKEKEYIYLGEFQNVKFTADELEKLKAEFPIDYQDRIERVSAYCASTGKKYKNYLATIRNWARKDPKPQEEPVRRYEQPW
jgi:biotin operon repressor